MARTLATVLAQMDPEARRKAREMLAAAAVLKVEEQIIADDAFEPGVVDRAIAFTRSLLGSLHIRARCGTDLSLLQLMRAYDKPDCVWSLLGELDFPAGHVLFVQRKKEGQVHSLQISPEQMRLVQAAKPQLTRAHSARLRFVLRLLQTEFIAVDGDAAAPLLDMWQEFHENSKLKQCVSFEALLAGLYLMHPVCYLDAIKLDKREAQAIPFDMHSSSLTRAVKRCTAGYPAPKRNRAYDD